MKIMAANFGQNYNVNASVEQLRSIIMDPRFATELRISLKSENKEPDRIWYRFHHGASMSSWGEKITITITPLQNGTTSLHIHSECGMPTQVIDWGKNKKIVHNIYAYMEKSYKNSYAQAQAQATTKNAPQQSAPAEVPQQNAPQQSAPAEVPQQNVPQQNVPQQAPPTVQTPKFCCNCGKPIDRTANFCSYCGSPISGKNPFCK